MLSYSIEVVGVDFCCWSLSADLVDNEIANVDFMMFKAYMTLFDDEMLGVFVC